MICVSHRMIFRVFCWNCCVWLPKGGKHIHPLSDYRKHRITSWTTIFPSYQCWMAKSTLSHRFSREISQAPKGHQGARLRRRFLHGLAQAQGQGRPAQQGPWLGDDPSLEPWSFGSVDVTVESCNNIFICVCACIMYVCKNIYTYIYIYM